MAFSRRCDVAFSSRAWPASQSRRISTRTAGDLTTPVGGAKSWCTLATYGAPLRVIFSHT